MCCPGGFSTIGISDHTLGPRVVSNKHTVLMTECILFLSIHHSGARRARRQLGGVMAGSWPGRNVTGASRVAQGQATTGHQHIAEPMTSSSGQPRVIPIVAPAVV